MLMSTFLDGAFRFFVHVISNRGRKPYPDKDLFGLIGNLSNVSIKAYNTGIVKLLRDMKLAEENDK